MSVLGGQKDVTRFIHVAAKRLGAGIEQRNGYGRLPVAHFPKPLQDRLSAIGFKPTTKISFERPSPAGTMYVHRAHPLVATLAEYIAEQALDTDRPEVGARASAMFARGIEKQTVLFSSVYAARYWWSDEASTVGMCS